MAIATHTFNESKSDRTGPILRCYKCPGPRPGTVFTFRPRTGDKTCPQCGNRATAGHTAPVHLMVIDAEGPLESCARGVRFRFYISCDRGSRTRPRLYSSNPGSVTCPECQKAAPAQIPACPNKLK